MIFNNPGFITWETGEKEIPQYVIKIRITGQAPVGRWR